MASLLSWRRRPQSAVGSWGGELGDENPWMLFTTKLTSADVIPFLKALLMLLACPLRVGSCPCAPPTWSPVVASVVAVLSLFALHASLHLGMSVGVGSSRSLVPVDALPPRCWADALPPMSSSGKSSSPVVRRALALSDSEERLFRQVLLARGPMVLALVTRRSGFFAIEDASPAVGR